MFNVHAYTRDDITGKSNATELVSGKTYYIGYNRILLPNTFENGTKVAGTAIQNIEDLSKYQWTVNKNSSGNISFRNPTGKYLTLAGNPYLVDSEVFFSFSGSVLAVGKSFLNYNSGFTSASSNPGISIYVYKLVTAEANFSNYKTSASLYVDYDYSDEIYTYNTVAIKFGFCVPASYKKELDVLGTTVRYGFKYTKDNTNYTVKYLTGAFCATELGADAIDETLDEAVNNNHYFQYVLTINNIPTNRLSWVVSAYAFVEIDGVMEVNNRVTWSAKSLAANYCENYSTDPAVVPYLNMLNNLANV